MTLQQSRYDEETEWDEDAPKVKKFMRTPSAYGYFTASFTPLKNLSASLSGNYTGRMLVGHAKHTLEDGTEVGPEAVDTPAFFTLNTKLAYNIRLSDYVKLELNAGIQNLTNAYQKDFDKGWGRDSAYIYGPGLPRCFFAGIKIIY